MAYHEVLAIFMIIIIYHCQTGCFRSVDEGKQSRIGLEEFNGCVGVWKSPIARDMLKLSSLWLSSIKRIVSNDFEFYFNLNTHYINMGKKIEKKSWDTD